MLEIKVVLRRAVTSMRCQLHFDSQFIHKNTEQKSEVAANEKKRQTVHL